LVSPFTSHAVFSDFWRDVREFILRINPHPPSPCT
jgi:hypothetical protein